MFKLIFVIFFCILIKIDCKYIEGVLKTSENWAFLTRFCFLSEEGQFEYQIDFNEDQGDPNLLLYYDTESQWPAVYKTNKTCEEKERVLNIRQNQIINLTARFSSYKDMSGCVFLEKPITVPTYNLIVPTLKPVNQTLKEKVTTKSAVTNEYSTEWSTIPSTSSEYTTYFDDNEMSTTAYDETFSSTDGISTTEITSTISVKPVKQSRLTKRYAPMTFYNDQLMRKGRTVMCHNARRFRSSRERWWFIAISNCDGRKGIDIRYRLLMTNGPPGDYWHEHFSADEFYILPVLMAFTTAYCFLLLGIVVCSLELKSRQLLHTTYKIFVFSVTIQLFGILFVSSCYLKLAISGFMVTKIRRFGQILMGISEISFLLLLLLLAKGYTVTRGRLPVRGTVKLTVFMCMYTVTYAALFIYESQVFDPGEVLYLYESPAGYGLIILRVAAWCMFIYSTIFTLKRFPEKGNFYYPFNVFGTVWFVAGPAFIISANTYIDKWVRESVVFAILLFISFGGHLMFLILTMPSVANKNFPYHVRTTQIGIMELTGRTGTSTMEQFGHHIYEPTATLREQTVIIPLTRRTEEIFENMYQQTNRRTSTDLPDTEPLHENERDKTIDNVLSWSLAKNLELHKKDRLNHNSDSATASAHSRSDISNVLSRNSSFRDLSNSKNITPHYEGYIREVPIELFTVSKMIVTTNNVPKPTAPPLPE
ncbi:transmembrane protein 145-like [Diorhabda sublineata]|uniref:transmembrane protein 145-like n=1 Tax=Diorhabda sublineata TaxID=1163346 RepID=UPI0024E1705A|nr:transmembrane protein 145-like [Diorhabda sublineata]